VRLEPGKPNEPPSGSPDPAGGHDSASESKLTADAPGADVWDVPGGDVPEIPVADATDAADASGADLGRRGFFRAFGREAIQAAANVVGTAGAIRRGTTAATAELLGLGIADPAAQAARLRSLGLDDSALRVDDVPAGLMAGAPGEAPTGFRSPYRVEGDAIVILDQRALPDRIVETACHSGAEVATQMRSLAVRGAPVLGQVAAYGLAITAAAASTHQPISRTSLIRATLNLLRKARPSAADVDHALDRLEARLASLGPDARGAVIADALRAEADAIAGTATLANARLARLGAAALPDVGDRPLRIVTLGSTGPLASGMVGTALGVVFALLAEGRECHVWVAETRPGLEGARLAALELARGGVRHTLIADAALGRLLAEDSPDICLVGAERICANGDTAAVTGTYPLALLAARHGVPLLVCAPSTTIDLSRADGSQLPREMRPELELTTLGSAALAPVGTEAWNPAVDTTPAELIAGFVTEEGVLRAPFEESLAVAVAAAGGDRVEATTPAGAAS
jgi:methylthioribose-1-phosphate isomerase